MLWITNIIALDIIVEETTTRILIKDIVAKSKPKIFIFVK